MQRKKCKESMGYVGIPITVVNKRSECGGRKPDEDIQHASPNRFFSPLSHKHSRNAKRKVGKRTRPHCHDRKPHARTDRTLPCDVVHWNKALSRTTLKPGRRMTDFSHDIASRNTGLLHKAVPFRSEVKMIRDVTDNVLYYSSTKQNRYSYLEYSKHLLTQISKYTSILYNPIVCVRYVGKVLWNSFFSNALSHNISYFVKLKFWTVPNKIKALSSNYASKTSKYWLVDPPVVPWNLLQYKTEGEDNFPTVIGRGTFGEVVAATLNFNGKCTDIVLKEFYSDVSTKDQIFDEAKITIYLKPTGCVPICYGLIVGNHGISGIALEMFGNGTTLDNVLDEHDLHSNDWLNMARQLADSLCKIHEMNILINDIKPDNVLVDVSGPAIKYCDFGCASYRNGIVFCSEGMDSFLHLSPEVRSGSITTKANDVFGLGRLLQQIGNISRLSGIAPTYHRCMYRDPERRVTAETASVMLEDAAKCFDFSANTDLDKRKRDRRPSTFSSGYSSDSCLSSEEFFM